MDPTRKPVDPARNPLDDLLHWRAEPTAVARVVRQSGARGPVTFTRGHAAAAAARVADGSARPDELAGWAHAVHLEDEVVVEDGHRDLLTRFLYEVSTPELFGPPTAPVCREWVRVLRDGAAP
ncbi:hypothetical protein LG634_09470 [Streptomyces bambusae]|uniref:hypothetical protein n=1 Tax=Streptomyces bambusae TaxID=1550616 RepID=UPI001CFEBCD5|nr:hypothetical protein [Streptomyces bambusae]MCB5165056.1 hypothetical protein [Streptomyces bambusae]